MKPRKAPKLITSKHEDTVAWRRVCWSETVGQVGGVTIKVSTVHCYSLSAMNRLTTKARRAALAGIRELTKEQ